tara:strand:+ start:388 stop:801 length:414 start_codon:yes stop_codon:yes gene_type:complete
MIIRKAELKDCDECEKISNIEEFRLPNGRLPNSKSFEQSLNQIFLVAEEENKILGLILGNKLPPDCVYLDLIVIHENFRGKGIGKKLLDAFRKELKEKGFDHYFLVSPSFNKDTLNFYKKNGLIEGKQYTMFCEDLK